MRSLNILQYRPKFNLYNSLKTYRDRRGAFVTQMDLS